DRTPDGCHQIGRPHHRHGSRGRRERWHCSRLRHPRTDFAFQKEPHRAGARKGAQRRQSSMSKYAQRPLDLSGLGTIPIHDRGGKVKVEDFAKPYTGGDVSAWIATLPHILAADSFRAVVEAVARARARKKMILWGLGGHVIKCGLAPILIDLM